MTQTTEHTPNQERDSSNKERHFDVTLIHVTEHLPTKSFEFIENEPEDKKGYMIGSALAGVSQAAAENYSQWVKSVADKHATNDGPDGDIDYELEASANGLDMAFGLMAPAGEKDTAFDRPATYIIDGRGNLIWSASNKPEAVGLILARRDGTIEQLGDDAHRQVGIVKDLAGDDELYIAPNSLVATMKETNTFNKDSFQSIIGDKSFPAEIIRVGFEEAADNEPATIKKEKRTPSPDELLIIEQRRDAARIRDDHKEQAFKARFEALDLKDVVTPVNIMQAFADDAELQAQIATAKASSVAAQRLSRDLSAPTQALDVSANKGDQDSVNTLGFSEMVRLAAQVEKYTQKVASYEELATEALARRMKGRLFKAPQYKTQAEKATKAKALKDAGKENTFGTKLSQMKNNIVDSLQAESKKNAKLDDDYMYLLEGFSRALDGALMKQWLAEGYSDEEVSKMLYEHQQTRQEARAARNHAELRKGKLASFLDKYANMPKGKKIAMTIGAAGVIGAAGLVAGGAFGVAGAIGLATAKVSKTYFQQRSKLYEEKRDTAMPGHDRAVSVANGKVSTKVTAAEQVFAGRKYDQAKREKAIKEADRNKKVAWGVAAASLAAIGVGAVAEHGDAFTKAWNKPLMPKIPTEVGDADGSWVADSTAGGANVELSGPPSSHLPELQDVSPAATINLGEGWLQTFNEVGITDPTQQNGLLNNRALMQEMVKRGLAYSDANIGGYGIVMTPDHKMPADALKLIKDYALRSGYDLAS